MLSVHFALRHLRAEGEGEYADHLELGLRRDATAVATRDLLRWDWPEWPPYDVYGRSLVLGEELVAATSWSDLKRLTSADLDSWLESLSSDMRARAEVVLGRL
jgi:hypothetical protein